jgi:hypothetical protein
MKKASRLYESGGRPERGRNAMSNTLRQSHHKEKSPDDVLYMADVWRKAKEYIAAGWAVFPLYSVNDGSCTCGEADYTPKSIGKHPMTENGFYDASLDPMQIDQWFGPGAHPCNLAIATGEVNQVSEVTKNGVTRQVHHKGSGVTVIDVDIGEGKVGTETWQALIKVGGEPQTLTANTGSGGKHFVFEYCKDLQSGNNRLGPNVDVKNDGGYIVVAPSRHRSGGVGYAWEKWDTPLCAVPPHLRQKIGDEPKTETRGRRRKDDLRYRIWSVAEVKEMLAAIPAENRDDWRAVGIILGRYFNLLPAAWDVYVEWADTWTGKKERIHDRNMRECFDKISQQSANKELSIGTIIKWAQDHGWKAKTGQFPADEFYYLALEGGGSYLYRQNLERPPATEKAVNLSVIPPIVDTRRVPASQWIRDHRTISGMTSDPDLEEFTQGVNSLLSGR